MWNYQILRYVDRYLYMVVAHTAKIDMVGCGSMQWDLQKELESSYLLGPHSLCGADSLIRQVLCIIEGYINSIWLTDDITLNTIDTIAAFAGHLLQFAYAYAETWLEQFP